MSGPGTPCAPAPPSPPRAPRRGAEAWRRLRQDLRARVGAGLLLAVVLLSVLGPKVAGALGEDPSGRSRTSWRQFPDLAFAPPTADEPFGRDALGRSYVMRVLEGGRTSLLVGLAATLVTVLIGTAYGAVAGYYGGRLDEVMMRLVDFLYGIPYLFLVVLIMLLFQDTARGNPVPVFAALGLVQWLTMARVVRGSVIAIREREYVLAARAIGASDPWILARHVLPNVSGVVIVYATLTAPAVIILESFLSYLGLGLDLSWGLLVSEAVGVVNPVRSYAWLLLFPSVLLATTLFSLNVVGDALRDALDPRTRR